MSRLMPLMLKCVFTDTSMDSFSDTIQYITVYEPAVFILLKECVFFLIKGR